MGFAAFDVAAAPGFGLSPYSPIRQQPTAPVTHNAATYYRWTSMSIVNLAAYHFATIEDTAAWRPHVTERCNTLGLRGTILLAPEGINLFVAGARENTDAFIHYIRHDPLFEGKFATLQFKESLSEKQPFTRMLVKLKREIITMKNRPFGRNWGARRSSTRPRSRPGSTAVTTTRAARSSCSTRATRSK